MKFPIRQIRQQFPSLAETDRERPRSFFDNPAGTQVTQGVIDAVSNCYLTSTANLGGHFKTSRNADKVVSVAHKAMADFLGTDDPGEIIIGSSMTALTFHMSRSICRDFKPGDEIILTRMDHEGNVAPWLEIARDKGLVIQWADFDKKSWRVEPETIRKLINDRTKLLAINYASNMMGAINDIATIAAEAKKNDVLVYVDAVQFAPHNLIDVKALNCDFLACSSYKFFGPHLGILWGRRELLEALHPYKCRCSDDDLPMRFEIGTPAVELLAGLTACVEHFVLLGEMMGANGSRREAIAMAFTGSAAYEDVLIGQLLEGLASIDDIEIIGPALDTAGTPRVPTLSFRHAAVSPSAIALALAVESIYVWHGHNYAFEMAKSLGIEDEGGVRIGIAHYNTAEEVARTVAAVEAAVSGA
ncbi:MAG: cysteine desulfurase-like protein [Hyphomonadaceae bacterium]